MKIALVSEHASPLATLGGVDAGGQNVHVAALATHLALLGHDVEVYTRRDRPDLPTCVPMRPGVRVVHLAAGPARPLPKDDLLPHMGAFGEGLAERWTLKGAPTLVHAHFWMSGLAALQAARGCGVPVAQTFHALGSVKRRHQHERDTSPEGRIAAEAMIGRSVDRVVATCTDEFAELLRLGVPPARISVVPCGVDVARFRPAAAPPQGTDLHRRARLLSLGRLVERKGVDTAIQALVLLPDAELVVAGGPDRADLSSDPEAVRLQALAVALGVAARVRLLGRVAHEEVPALIASAQVVVATPWYEPFGIVPLEAAACARPVVGSAVGGMLDTVQDGRTGLLVPPRDPEALARAVRRLLDDPAWAHRMGAAARRAAVRRFRWDHVAAATVKVYREIAGLAGLEHEAAG